MKTPCRSGERPESNVPDRLWDWWNEDQQRRWLQVQPWTMLTRGTGMGLWHPALSVNRITAGISGIKGHLGLHVAMMMGGRRGHSG